MMEEGKKMPEDISGQVDKFWSNPENILHLIDLIFLSSEQHEDLPS